MNWKDGLVEEIGKKLEEGTKEENKAIHICSSYQQGPLHIQILVHCPNLSNIGGKLKIIFYQICVHIRGG